MSTYTWQSPSNIALVKYWGKHGVQLPANPSISFTLSACYTETSLELVVRSDKRISFEFEGKARPDFEPKLEALLDRVAGFLPWLADYSYKVCSENTFPHSSGIASSASAMSAFALCLASAHADLSHTDLDMQLASEMARLGSGSACRSVFGGYTTWGKSKMIDESSDRHAIQLDNIHPDFSDLQDTVLLIDSGQKQVSSTVGHGLMNGHPFAQARYEQAHSHIGQLTDILAKGNFTDLANLIELEALTLHAMMMSSSPHFMLFKSGSVSVISRVMELRAAGAPLSFTLDAGANVHLIYPKTFTQEALGIIEKEFKTYCQNGQYICDEIGKGPNRLT